MKTNVHQSALGFFPLLDLGEGVRLKQKNIMRFFGKKLLEDQTNKLTFFLNNKELRARKKIYAILNQHAIDQIDLNHEDEFKSFNIFIRNSKKQIVGGIYGSAEYGWLFIEAIGIDKSYRGKGLGKKLMDLAEELAIDWNCVGVELHAYDFHPIGFYKKLGFDILFRRDNKRYNTCMNHLTKLINHDQRK